MQTRQPNVTKANHVLPICYQEAFTKADGELFVQYLDKDKPASSLHPKVVGVMNRFYTHVTNGVADDGVEKFFSTYIEGEYAPVAKRIKEQRAEFVLETKEVPALLKFVAAQIVRTQAHRLCINQQAGSKVDTRVFTHSMGTKMKKMADRWIAKVPDVILLTPLPHVNTQFITGDNPVICFADSYPTIVTPFEFRSIINIDDLLTLSHNGFSVPLSPFIGMTIHNGGSGKLDRVPRSITPEVVKGWNRAVYDQCVQFVAALDADHLDFHVKRTAGAAAGLFA